MANEVKVLSYDGAGEWGSREGGGVLEEVGWVGLGCGRSK